MTRNRADGLRSGTEVCGRIGTEFLGDVLWRPWRDNNPATWSDFYAATHPPIPEGWEAVGEWVCIAPKMVLAEDAVWFHEGGGMWVSAVAICGWSVPVRRALPAIPEGWEQVDKWKHRDAIVVLLNDGERLLLGDGQITQGGSVSGWCTVVRRVPPPADWGDVPRGVYLEPVEIGGALYNAVVVNGKRLGEIQQTTAVWWLAYKDGTAQRCPSQPAAIVALTGRREKG